MICVECDLIVHVFKNQNDFEIQYQFSLTSGESYEACEKYCLKFVVSFLQSTEDRNFRDLGDHRDQNSEESDDLVQEVKQILSQNLPNSIKLCDEGLGGTYFILNEAGKRIAVFKPTDEEPGAMGNPKGIVSAPLLPPGGGSIREVAAYRIDQGFAGVPETYLVHGIKHDSLSGIKSGSLQCYVDHTEDSDISSSRFQIDDVHKIGIFDVRLYNMDRNIENILIQNSQSPKLIPIDHTYILPPALDFIWFEWLHWKQAKQPFSKEHLDYIQAIDIEKDAMILHQLGFESAAIRTMKISTSLLKIAALNFGYNLFQIGSLLSRKNTKSESTLEKMVKKTESLLSDSNNEEHFLQKLTQVIEEELNTISKS